MKIRVAVVVVIIVAILGILFSRHTVSIVNDSSAEEVTPTPTPQPKQSLRSNNPPNPVMVKLIVETAERHGINSERFLATAMCESTLRPGAVGDGGSSYGIFQIHLPAHPTVTKEQALDPYFAVEWSAAKFKANPRIWSCYKKLYE